MVNMLAIAFTMLFVISFNPAAQANNHCEALVVDEAGLFGNQFAKVEEAAKALVNLGADVRVRTIRSFGSIGTLEKYEKQIEKNCASWTAPDGGRKNNLIVFMISKNDRKTGIYFGSQWRRALNDRYTQIMTDRMNPRFRDGDFAGGFVEGLRTVMGIIDSDTRPPTPYQQPPVVIVPQAPSPPPDYSGLWRILLLIVILAALGGLIWLAVSYRQAAEKRRAAQQKARLARQGCASRINDFPERLKMAEIKMDALALNVSPEDLKSANELLAEAKTANNSAGALFTDLDHSAGNPDRSNLTETEYENIAKAYEPVLAQLREADKLINGVGEHLASLEKITRVMPKLVEALASRIESVKATIVATKSVFDELTRNYNPDSLESVRGNGTEAASRINWSLKAFKEAQEAGSPQTKQWLKAQEIITKANGWLDEAESLMRSIAALKVALETAGHDAPQELARAQADLEKCWDYMHKYDDDIRESLKDDLRAAEKQLEAAKKELEKTRPNYLAAIDAAKDVHNTADKILAQEREEYEAAERLRHRTVSALRDAKAAVSKAKEYIEDHSGCIGKTARCHLDEAENLLTKAQSAQNLKERVDLAEAAESKADSAYSKAQEEVRKEYGNRQSYTNVVVIGGGWGSSSPSSPQESPYYNKSDSDRKPNGGGDTNWGSSDSGGGGDIDTDSSGGGGGGDSSW